MFGKIKFLRIMNNNYCENKIKILSTITKYPFNTNSNMDSNLIGHLQNYIITPLHMYSKYFQPNVYPSSSQTVQKMFELHIKQNMQE